MYRATNEFVLPPAHKTEFEGGATVHASEVVVWAEAVQEGASAVSTVPGQYTVGGLDGACRPEEPAAGTWWPDYALDLVMQTQTGHPFTGH